MRGGIVAGITAAVLLLSAATPAHATFPGQNGKIAVARYVSVGHFPGDSEIYTVNPDGSGAAALTDSASPEYSNAPAWSPDGEKIAFSHRAYHFSTPSCESACADVYVMNADGSAVTQLTNDGNSHRPSWSPDGTKIAFDRSPDASLGEAGDSNIYVMNPDGTGVAQVTTGPAIDYGPVWSPDGSEIAFNRLVVAGGGAPATPQLERLNRTDIHAVAPDGSGERLIVGEPSQHPNWSPDGKRIAFDDDNEIHVVGRDGTHGIQVTNDPPPVLPPDGSFPGIDWNINPAWSPDGHTIVFEHNSCGFGGCSTPYLETVNPDDTGRVTLGYNTGGEPDWQAIPGPQRSEYKNAAHFCKALREFLGDEAFRSKFGGGANAHGKCVTANRR
jgi:TolB protein